MVSAETSTLLPLHNSSSTSSSAFVARRQRASRVLFVMAMCAMVGCALLLFVTNVHRPDRKHKPEEEVLLSSSAPAAAAHPAAPHPAASAAASKAALKLAAVAKRVAAATHPTITEPHVPSTEERIESVLRKNLDRTADSLAKEQLQPLLLAQGKQVLHNARSKIAEAMDEHDGKQPAQQQQHQQQQEEHDMDHNSGVKDVDGTHGDLHQALIKHHSDAADNSNSKPFHHASKEDEEDRTESALRKQLNMETQRKEQQMFKSALAKVHAQFESSSKKNGISHDTFDSDKKSKEDDGVSQSQKNEEEALKAQLEASVKAKQKEMYNHAFKSWLEKQQAVKIKKAKKEVTIEDREKELFKDTLEKAKEEGPELAKKLKREHDDDSSSSSASAQTHKPSFSTWLKAFKRQLAERTKAASKKIAEARYTTAATKKGAKKGAKTVATPASPVLTIKEAEEKRERAEKAVKELQESLKLEQQEEKAVSNAEDKETTPGKALALLKKTMAKERAALREISKDEAGVGADPNIAALAPKPAKPKEHDSGILGLDDIGYY